MLKKELIGSVIYSKDLGINIEVDEKNIEVLKSIKADVFENDKPKEAISKRNSSDFNREGDNK